jgi:hypothetical protein
VACRRCVCRRYESLRRVRAESSGCRNERRRARVPCAALRVPRSARFRAAQGRRNREERVAPFLTSGSARSPRCAGNSMACVQCRAVQERRARSAAPRGERARRRVQQKQQRRMGILAKARDDTMWRACAARSGEER